METRSRYGADKEKYHPVLPQYSNMVTNAKVGGPLTPNSGPVRNTTYYAAGTAGGGKTTGIQPSAYKGVN